MIFTNTRNWQYASSLEPLLMFAQRMLELSFDKSAFLEKNISPSLSSIIAECLDLIDYSEKNSYQVPEVEFEVLFEELREKIRHDDISKDLLGEKKERYLSLLVPNGDKKSIKNTLQILSRKLQSDLYFNKSKDLIKKLVLTKEKDKLMSVTTRMFEFLTDYGYQKGTIYYGINKFFFDRSGQKKIQDTTILDDFFNFFDLEIKEFEVVFVGSTIFKEIENSCNKFGLSIEDNKSVLYDKYKEERFFHNANKKKVFITCEMVMAVDYLHAMKLAAERVSLVSDLFVVFHHQSKPWFSEYSLVYNHTKKHVANIHAPTNIMSKSDDTDLSYAKSIFPIFLDRFSLETDSFQRFKRGVELHSLSLKTDETASQVLNLWICLETLLINEQNKTHITIVSDAVILISSRLYIVSIINSLYNLLVKWNKVKLDIVINKLPESIREDKRKCIAALISVPEFKDLGIELLAEMDEQPLLKNKFMNLVKIVENTKKLSAQLTQHEKRCKWDIRRIYRARNKIVHQGNINEHSDYIVETAHHYLDIVLRSIIERKINFKDINSIDNLMQEFTLIKEHETATFASIRDEKLNIDNFATILFGPDQ